MPTAVATDLQGSAAAPDVANRSLNYDDAVEDFLADLPLGGTEQNGITAQQASRDEDQEVQVKRQRKPIPKLDENCLLSNAGIPRLRKITKTRVKFRGKGHEFSDISRLLNTYQLWLDDLYPRAKFRDALAMVEKVGHSKRMQVTRKAWLDETKPNRRELSPEPYNLDPAGVTEDIQNVAYDSLMDTNDSIFGDDTNGADIVPGITTATDSRATLQADAPSQMPRMVSKGPFEIDSGPEDDELDALLAENVPTTSLTSNRHDSSLQHDDEPNEDELDALLAEDATSAVRHATAGLGERQPSEEAPEDDELEAMMSQLPASHAPSSRPPPDPRLGTTEDDFAAEEEAMADMADM